MALLRLADAGRRPRCGEWAEVNLWLSEDPAERAQAVGRCAGCPVLLECDTAAVELRVTFGVWAGRDRAGKPAAGGGRGAGGGEC